jgi:hypothetical protein
MKIFKVTMVFVFSISLLMGCVCLKNGVTDDGAGLTRVKDSQRDSEKLELIYYRAFLALKEADRSKHSEDRVRFLQQALGDFQSIQRSNPSWRENIVRARISDTMAKMNSSNQPQ